MKENLLNDIFSWDVFNWSRSLNRWKEIDLNIKKRNCLEVGAGPGGLSLWLALNCNRVLCTDFSSDLQRAKDLHERYGVQHLISYQSLDVMNIPFENEFDLIVSKSVLGGIGANENVKVALHEIYKALKPGGCFLFAENLKGSKLLMKLRRLFSPCGNSWNYLEYGFFEDSLSRFSNIELSRLGVFGVLGRTNFQQKMLGKIDRLLLERIFPKSCFYIVVGIAFK